MVVHKSVKIKKLNLLAALTGVKLAIYQDSIPIVGQAFDEKFDFLKFGLTSGQTARGFDPREFKWRFCDLQFF